MIHQQVQATTAPQTAQLNVLAEGLQQVHVIAQKAHAAVVNALAAPLRDTAQSTSGSALPRAQAPTVVDMSMDHNAYNDHLGNPVNSSLPPYTDVKDHGLWLLQVPAWFQAHQTPAAQLGLWIVTAFRGPAMKFWFFECAGQPAEPEIISTTLKELYLHYAYEYGLHAQMQSLQMQPGNYTTYADLFSELANQLRGMNPTHLMYMFLNGLTADYKQHVLLHGATSFAEVQETCRPLGLATRT